MGLLSHRLQFKQELVSESTKFIAITQNQKADWCQATFECSRTLRKNNISTQEQIKDALSQSFFFKLFRKMLEIKRHLVEVVKNE